MNTQFESMTHTLALRNAFKLSPSLMGRLQGREGIHTTETAIFNTAILKHRTALQIGCIFRNNWGYIQNLLVRKKNVELNSWIRKPLLQHSRFSRFDLYQKMPKSCFFRKRVNRSHSKKKKTIFCRSSADRSGVKICHRRVQNRDSLMMTCERGSTQDS